MSIPANLIVGDSASWTDDPFIDANGKRYESGTYTLKYELRGGGVAVSITAAANGTGWKTTLPTTVSATLVAGLYFWAAVLTATGERITIAHGEFNALADITTAGAAYDGRSQAEIALGVAENALATFKSSQGRIRKYTIGGRSMEFGAVSEILEVISYWRTRIANEHVSKQIADGLGNPKNLYVRFNQS